MKHHPLVIATSNPGKLAEFRSLFTDTSFKIMGLADIGSPVLPDEVGSTYEENAKLKAQAVMQICKLPTLADDSGLEVEALSGRPGLYSARFSPVREKNETQADANCRYLIEQLRSLVNQNTNFAARFVCALCFVEPVGTCVTFRGEVSGSVLLTPRGNNGFGYDPLLYLAETDCTFAELNSQQKNALSHRGRAIKQFILWWNTTHSLQKIAE